MLHMPTTNRNPVECVFFRLPGIVVLHVIISFSLHCDPLAIAVRMGHAVDVKFVWLVAWFWRVQRPCSPTL